MKTNVRGLPFADMRFSGWPNTARSGPITHADALGALAKEHFAFRIERESGEELCDAVAGAVLRAAAA